MRISSSFTYQTGAAGINRQQNTLFELQKQLNSLKRINSPSDDPVAAARVLDTKQSDSRNAQFIENTKAVDSALQFSDNALQTVSDIMTQMKEMVVRAGNPAFKDTDLKIISGEFDGKMEELVGVLNTTDGQGNYLFSGTKTSTPPYTIEGSRPYGADTVIRYNGNDGQKSVQTGTARQIAITDPGSATFGTGSTVGRDSGNIFDTMLRFGEMLKQGRDGLNPKASLPANGGTSVTLGVADSIPNIKNATAAAAFEDLKDAFGQGGVNVSLPAGMNDTTLPTLPAPYNANFQVAYDGKVGEYRIRTTGGEDTGLTLKFENLPTGALAADSVTLKSYTLEAAQVMKGVDKAHERSLSTLAAVGSRRLEVEQSRDLGEDLNLVYKKSISDLEDLNIAEASTSLVMAKTALEASQLSFSKVSSLSLFNYIS
ncbi:flagellar hook-associated protein FlgL [Aquaspirillum serpens]|uniref:flagellar hook-associated protein FlgL n=1 Tax=Aquaspirillum serpens TaxID=190 RepID=UPI0003B6C18B|nr:flagellar hook-associated protein FlgL [Aquaspirillum serpens]